MHGTTIKKIHTYLRVFGSNLFVSLNPFLTLVLCQQLTLIIVFYVCEFLKHIPTLKSKNNENFKKTILSNNYDRTKTTGESGMF